MKIIFLGFAVPKLDFESAAYADSHPQFQGTNLMWRMIEGIEMNSEYPLKLLGFVPASDYPKNPRLIFGRKKWSHKNMSNDVVLPYLNLFILKHITRFVSALTSLFSTLYPRKNDYQHLIVYVMHSPILFAAVFAKILFKIKVTLVILDLPAFMNVGVKISPIRKMAKLIDSFLMKFAVGKIDGCIVLTNAASEKFRGLGKECLIIEGISSQDPDRFGDLVIANGIFKIVYTGAIVDLNLLLDAMNLLNSDHIQLHITGRGDMVQDVVKHPKFNKTIFYHGFLNETDLKNLLLEATVLINVRPSDTPFIEYSFPSKLIEYMQTGRPVISTNLPGIPVEYFQHIYLLSNETPAGLADLINVLFKLPIDELRKKGHEANEFVRSRKSPITQGAKICRFISR